MEIYLFAPRVCKGKYYLLFWCKDPKWCMVSLVFDLDDFLDLCCSNSNPALAPDALEDPFEMSCFIYLD